VAPQIQFDVFLPTATWRQLYLQLGCASLCGNIDFFADAADNCVPLSRGDFVLATDNEGHVGVSPADATFGADPQLRVDFGYRSDHVVALVAERLITLYYGQGPRYSYFDGCSQGGHEGLTEAQRYPHDFDGIVAGAPASVLTALLAFSTAWHATANTDAQGRPIEHGVAPGRLVATKYRDDGTVTRTRPVYTYPTVARYDGTGSIDDAANFAPAPPTPHKDAISWLGSFRSGYEQTCGWRNGRWVCTPALSYSR
jgi:hypothetical protein